MEYFAPRTIAEALICMRRWKGKSALIAGGTNIIPSMRAGELKQEILVDLRRLKSLSYIKEEKHRIRIGGLSTISELVSSKVIQRWVPLLFDAAQQLGNPLVRNRATIGGNLADASPAADTAVPLLALEAIVVIQGRKERQVPIDQFFVGPNRTVLKRDEMIKEVIIPKLSHKVRMAYFKLGLRNSMAVSVVNLALLMEMEKNICKRVRIGFGAVAPKPIRAYQIEKMLENNEVTGKLLETCCKAISKEVHPISDIRASKEYRIEMASVLLKRGLREL
ncbi:MAG: xanthine dehydrogenase family protein subunit M, partial [Deltaproteobacteria bacterium]|nr:xanthine dehydrogenase family protein subunit M [Deltaproteobacteria bacterium]